MELQLSLPSAPWSIANGLDRLADHARLEDVTIGCERGFELGMPTASLLESASSCCSEAQRARRASPVRACAVTYEYTRAFLVSYSLTNGRTRSRARLGPSHALSHVVALNGKVSQILKCAPLGAEERL